MLFNCGHRFIIFVEHVDKKMETSPFQPELICLCDHLKVTISDLLSIFGLKKSLLSVQEGFIAID